MQRGRYGLWFTTIVVLWFLPAVSANEGLKPFPDIPFQVFSDFILQIFHKDITLPTVLTLLFTLTTNPDLLNLHSRQQHPRVQGEIEQLNSGWIKALARTLEQRLGDATTSLFSDSHTNQHFSHEGITSQIGLKLDAFAKLLGLHPYDSQGLFLGKCKPISEKNIEPVHIICPASMECETVECQSWAIRNQTRDRDVPQAVLIRGTKIYNNVSVLTGQCSKCHTRYFADHE